MLTLVDDPKVRERMGEAIAHAVKVGLLCQLFQQLVWLDRYGNAEGQRGPWTVELGCDFAPYSFSVVWRNSGEFAFNGGLIYQGPEAPGDGSFPALSVSLTKADGWFTHT